MGRKRPTNKLTIQKVWVENDPGSTKRGSNIEVRRRLRGCVLLCAQLCVCVFFFLLNSLFFKLNSTPIYSNEEMYKQKSALRRHVC